MGTHIAELNEVWRAPMGRPVRSWGTSSKSWIGRRVASGVLDGDRIAAGWDAAADPDVSGAAVDLAAKRAGRSVRLGMASATLNRKTAQVTHERYLDAGFGMTRAYLDECTQRSAGKSKGVHSSAVWAVSRRGTKRQQPV